MSVKSRYWLVLIRVCSLLAVLVSSALLLHYVAPEESGLCGARSGCEAVRKSALVAALPSYTIPALGIAGYIGIFWLSFYPRLRAWLRWAGALGGVLALGFIVQQAIGIGAFCWMCLTVDGLAITVAFACVAFTNPGSDWQTQVDPLRGWGWVLLLGLALNAPAVWLKVKPNESLPAAIAELQKPGVLNVIEFVDFECPHCRRLHPVLASLTKSMGEPVEVQRFNVPLSFHIHAEGAARAAVCAAAIGKGEEMAELLFGNPLTGDVWFEHAKTLGLDPERFRSCLDSDATNETLADHVDLFKSTGARGLPLTFIGTEVLRGAPDAATVRETFARATTPSKPTISGPLFLVLLLTLCGAVALLFRKRTTNGPHDEASRLPHE